MNISQMIVQAVLKYNFRAAKSGEDFAAYKRALIEHVNERDWAAAHELRIGKPQSEWSSADMSLFVQIMQSMPRLRREFQPGSRPLLVMEAVGPHRADDATLDRLASAGLESLCERRKENPEEELPCFVSALLQDGKVLTTSPDTVDRVATVHLFQKLYKVHGFFIVFDAFAHNIDPTHGKAQKVDAICAQVGSRTMGRIKTRPYHYVNGRTAVVFDEAPPDHDKTKHRGRDQVDPYENIIQ